jgi:TetR/AcrR family transcriptional regulator
MLAQLPAEADPACLLVMLMAAAMATTTLPHVIEGVYGIDPRSPELVEHFADQVGVLARLIGLGPA